MKWIHLILGGTAGTLSRYVLSGFIHQIFGAQFPYGTLTVNLLGCFLIGFLAAISEEKFVLDSNARLLLMVGFCGAFTTFSTFIFESANLIRDGQTMSALINVLASVLLGFLVFRAGIFLAEMI